MDRQTSVHHYEVGCAENVENSVERHNKLHHPVGDYFVLWGLHLDSSCGEIGALPLLHREMNEYVVYVR